MSLSNNTHFSFLGVYLSSKLLLATSTFFKVVKTIDEINFKSKVLKLFIANCFVSFLGEPKSVHKNCKHNVAVHSENERSNHRRCYVKKGVLKSLRPATLLKERLWHRCFPVNFAKL